MAVLTGDLQPEVLSYEEGPMLRELENPGFAKIVMYLAVICAVAIALFLRGEGDSLILTQIQGALRS
jgi:hypothetical protein